MHLYNALYMRHLAHVKFNLCVAKFSPGSISTLLLVDVLFFKIINHCSQSVRRMFNVSRKFLKKKSSRALVFAKQIVEREIAGHL